MCFLIITFFGFRLSLQDEEESDELMQQAEESSSIFDSLPIFSAWIYFGSEVFVIEELRSLMRCRLPFWGIETLWSSWPALTFGYVVTFRVWPFNILITRHSDIFILEPIEKDLQALVVWLFFKVKWKDVFVKAPQRLWKWVFTTQIIKRHVLFGI